METAFASCFPLRAARSHEVFGPGATAFAMFSAASAAGEVLWISEKWRSEQIFPPGFRRFTDPERILLVRTAGQADSLMVAEESLRSGAAPLVIAELSRPLSLTTGRRLQLAAKAGESTLLSIIPEGMGSNAAETRWYCAPLFAPGDSTLQRWQLIKNKSGTSGMWDIGWDAEARRVIVVSKAGQRPDSQDAAD